MPDLDGAFAALADPTRRAIVVRLSQGDATVTQLAEPFAMTQPAISHHLRVLESAGLIMVRMEGAKRPRRLVRGEINALYNWLGGLREALERNYDRLDRVLKEEKK
jgi:DNA-binding transcriptional ArsR family regulator